MDINKDYFNQIAKCILYDKTDLNYVKRNVGKYLTFEHKNFEGVITSLFGLPIGRIDYQGRIFGNAVMINAVAANCTVTGILTEVVENEYLNYGVVRYHIDYSTATKDYHDGYFYRHTSFSTNLFSNDINILKKRCVLGTLVNFVKESNNDDYAIYAGNFKLGYLPRNNQRNKIIYKHIDNKHELISLICNVLLEPRTNKPMICIRSHVIELSTSIKGRDASAEEIDAMHEAELSNWDDYRETEPMFRTGFGSW